MRRWQVSCPISDTAGASDLDKIRIGPLGCSAGGSCSTFTPHFLAGCFNLSSYTLCTTARHPWYFYWSTSPVFHVEILFFCPKFRFRLRETRLARLGLWVGDLLALARNLNLGQSEGGRSPLSSPSLGTLSVRVPTLPDPPWLFFLQCYFLLVADAFKFQGCGLHPCHPSSTRNSGEDNVPQL